MKNKKTLLIISLVLIVILLGVLVFISFNKKEETKEFKKVAGVWQSTDKVVNIISRKGDKVVTDDNGHPFYLVINEDGSTYAIFNEVNKGKITLNDDEITLNLENKPISTCKLINNELNCESYAKFKKVK